MYSPVKNLFCNWAENRLMIDNWYVRVVSASIWSSKKVRAVRSENTLLLIHNFPVELNNQEKLPVLNFLMSSAIKHYDIQLPLSFYLIPLIC